MSDTAGITHQQILDMFMESQHWPPDVMLDFQRSQLEQLLRHARANVPFYETRLDCMFRADDSVDWERWNDIPVLTRQDVQQHRDALLARNLPEGHGSWREFTTSGSTARPITIRVPAIMSLVGRAAWNRFYQAHGIAKSARFAFLRTERDDGTPIVGGVVEDERADGKGPIILVARDLSAQQKLQILRERRPDVLADSPNSLEILARRNLDCKQPFQVRWVIGFGMGFTPDQIELLQSSFGASVLSSYASKESGPIALQCPNCDTYHVCEELVVVDRDFSGPRSIVLTPLFQSAQPFIRYLQNDIVHLKPSCSCGHQQLTITKIDGRVEPIFKLPSGLEVSDLSVAITKSSFSKICVANQLAQIAPLHFKMRYMADRSANADEEQELLEVLRQRLHPDIHVSFHRVEEIPFNAGGKQQRFVREFDQT
jgi:phenylacetate-CoA ligase